MQLLEVPSASLPKWALPGIIIAGFALALFPWLRRDDPKARMFTVGVSITLMTNYILWRLCNTLPARGLTLNFAVGVPFCGIEVIEIIRCVVFLGFMSRTRDRTPDVEANMAWLAAQKRPPLVDVLICTYNEEETILERTIIGATAMDYPNYRVFVLDDGKRPWLKDLCENFGCHYVTRSDNAHAKAGNINNGLKHLASLETQPDFISILDADFVATPVFLTRAMTLFRDESVGIVQTPQHFVNNDPIQSNLSVAKVWPDEQRLFFDSIMPAKDAWGLAMCCGTSAVIRMVPLQAVGGFPTDSVTEDYLVTLRLKEIGYQTIYLNEPLTVGLAPEGLKEYNTQRARWCLGLMQIMRGRSGPFARNTLSMLDRINLVEVFLSWASTYPFQIMGLVIPSLYLLFGIQAVNAGLSDMSFHFFPYFIWQFALMNWLSGGRVLPVMSDICRLASCPAVLRATANGLLNPTNQNFKVTAKGGDRSGRFVEWPVLKVFLPLLALTVAGIAMYSAGYRSEQEDANALNFAWSCYNVVVLVITCLVCVEQPRYRKAERLASGEPITLIADDKVASRDVLDVSIGGARIAGPAPAAFRQTIQVIIAGMTMNATIVRVENDAFAIEFEATPANRSAMTRRIYSGRYTAPRLQKIDASAVGRAVLSRIFR